MNASLAPRGPSSSIATRAGRARAPARAVPLVLAMLLLGGLLAMPVASAEAGTASAAHSTLTAAATTTALGVGVPVTLSIRDSTGATVTPATRPVAIAAGNSHTCAVLSTGGATCWGLGNDGRLGNGQPSRSESTPFPVVGVSSAIAIGAGNTHSCVLLAAGGVQCWGSNGFGQLGDGLGSGSNVAVAVSTLSTARSLGVGGHHNCAVLASGSVSCWGLGTSGQLGNGGSANSNVPVAVSGITNAVAVSAGAAHTCALLADGTVMCWGSGTSGQLGRGTASSSPTPAAVFGLIDAVAISAGGSHSCAVRSDGTAKCWGTGGNGQLGNGGTSNSNTPLKVTGLSNAVAIAAGSSHSCARLADGGVRCWGSDQFGQLGNGAAGDSLVPTAVTNLTQAASLAANTGTCLVQRDGVAKCWGSGSFGQIGDGGSSHRQSPTSVTGYAAAASPTLWLHASLGSLQDIAHSGSTVTATFRSLVGGTSTLSATLDGSPVGAPDQPTIQVAFAPVATAARSTLTVASPTVGPGTDVTVTLSLKDAAGTPVALPTRPAGVSSSNHNCSWFSDGTAACWGTGTSGQLGNGATGTSATAGPVTGLSTAIAIAAGGAHSCALRANGTVTCWGFGANGQLGNGADGNSNVPLPVSGLTNVIAVSAGNSHSCALRFDGSVRCWGLNIFGQLGNGGTGNSNVPVAVSGISNAVAISAGIYHNCALLADGTAKCWGFGGSGRLGHGSSSDSNVPVAVSGLTGAIAISAADSISCAVLANGGARCWGSNAAGQLGNGGGSSSNVPVAVSGITTAVAISAGGSHACAVLADGTARCWGQGDNGRLGNAGTTSSNVPVVVSGLSGTVAISAGFSHSCAILSNATVRCWGQGLGGRLGDGSGSDSSRPVAVAGHDEAASPTLSLQTTHGTLSRLAHSGSTVTATFRSLTGGTATLSALLNGVAVGAPDQPTIQVALPPSAPHSTLTAAATTADAGTGVAVTLTVKDSAGSNVALPVRPVDLGTGAGHSCAVLSNGTARCWGGANNGRLGNGALTGPLTPVWVRNLPNAVAISNSLGHSCALLSDGTAKCWGTGANGRLGNGGTLDATTPVVVTGLTGAVSVVAGHSQSCAVLANGTAKCWGLNTQGQLGNGATGDRSTPVAVAGLTNIVAIHPGNGRTCAVLADGTVTCWGTGSGLTPVQVSGLTDVVALSLGDNGHSCAVLANGTARCWGTGTNGRLGNGGSSNSATPVPVSGLATAVAISAGHTHSCALLANGTARCWGFGTDGRLGNGATSLATTPVAVTGLTNAVAIGAGYTHSCALLADGIVKCWGENALLGIGSNSGNSNTPVSVSGHDVPITPAVRIQTTLGSLSKPVHGSGTVTTTLRSLHPGVATLGASLGGLAVGAPDVPAVRFLTVCTATQYQSAAGSFAADRVCTSLTACGEGESQATAPTPTSDRTCAPADTDGDGTRDTLDCEPNDAAQAHSRTLDPDCSPPTIAAHADVNVAAVDASGATVQYGLPAVTDSRESLTAACTPAPGSRFAVGRTTVTCTAQDAAGFQAVPTTFAVNVTDQTAPVVDAHDAVTAAAQDATGALVQFLAPAARDNVDGLLATTCVPASGSRFALGTTTVTCTVRDAAQNLGSGAFTVTVTDQGAPTIAPHADVRVAATGPAGATVTYDAPAASDAVDPSPQLSCQPLSGSTFALGNTTVTCQAQDAAGNRARSTFTVTVVDEMAPTLAAAQDLVVPAEDASGATVDYSLPAASDAVDAEVLVTCTPAPRSRFGLGDTTVTCTATDRSGNSASPVTFNVKVADADAPVIQPQDDVVAAVADRDGRLAAVVTYTPPQSNDNVDGASAAACLPASGGEFPLGNTTITCSATDAAGNTATATTFLVRVTDQAGPVIALKANVTASATGADGAAVAYDAPTASDAVDGTVAVVCAPASGSRFALGNTTVACDAQDAAGNPAGTVRFTVLVKDTVPPVLGAHADVLAAARDANGSLVRYDLPSITDDVGGAEAFCTPAPGTRFGLGSTPVTCQGIDNGGNRAQPVRFLVNVTDQDGPRIAVADPVTAAAQGPDGAIVAFQLPLAQDNVDATVFVSCSPLSGARFPLGKTNVTCTAQDAAGNHAQPRTFVVNVTDQQAPVIAQPADRTLLARTANGTAALYDAPQATDDVDGAFAATCTPGAQDVLTPGPHQVTCNASDAAGNAAVAVVFTLRVRLDLDGDGIPDDEDPDLDGDGVANALDLFPRDGSDWADLDGDLLGDNADPDADADTSPKPLDCNDVNRTIRPGGIEVANDGIDQDCSGADLVVTPPSRLDPNVRVVKLRPNAPFTIQGSNLARIDRAELVGHACIQPLRVLSAGATQVTVFIPADACLKGALLALGGPDGGFFVPVELGRAGPLTLHVTPEAIAFQQTSRPILIENYRAELWDDQFQTVSLPAVAWSVQGGDGNVTVDENGTVFIEPNTLGEYRIVAATQDATAFSILTLTRFGSAAGDETTHLQGDQIASSARDVGTGNTTSTIRSVFVPLATVESGSSVAFTAPTDGGNATRPRIVSAATAFEDDAVDIVLSIQITVGQAPAAVDDLDLAQRLAANRTAAPAYISITATESGIEVDEQRLNELLGNSTVRFTVPLSFFTAGGFDPSRLNVVEYNGGRVVATTTAAADSTAPDADGNLRFTLRTSTYSSFALLGIPVAPVTTSGGGGGGGGGGGFVQAPSASTPQPATVPAATSTTSSSGPTTAPVVPTQPARLTPNQRASSDDGRPLPFNAILVMALVYVLAVGLVVALVLRRKE